MAARGRPHGRAARGEGSSRRSRDSPRAWRARGSDRGGGSDGVGGVAPRAVSARHAPRAEEGRCACSPAGPTRRPRRPACHLRAPRRGCPHLSRTRRPPLPRRSGGPPRRVAGRSGRSPRVHRRRGSVGTVAAGASTTPVELASPGRVTLTSTIGRAAGSRAEPGGVHRVPGHRLRSRRVRGDRQGHRRLHERRGRVERDQQLETSDVRARMGDRGASRARRGRPRAPRPPTPPGNRLRSSVGRRCLALVSLGGRAPRRDGRNPRRTDAEIRVGRETGARG